MPIVQILSVKENDLFKLIWFRSFSTKNRTTRSPFFRHIPINANANSSSRPREAFSLYVNLQILLFCSVSYLELELTNSVLHLCPSFAHHPRGKSISICISSADRYFWLTSPPPGRRCCKVPRALPALPSRYGARWGTTPCGAAAGLCTTCAQPTARGRDQAPRRGIGKVPWARFPLLQQQPYPAILTSLRSQAALQEKAYETSAFYKNIWASLKFQIKFTCIC